MSVLWTTSASVSMLRAGAASVIIDPETLRCVKDRAQGRPGRQATELEIVKATINATEDDERRERARAWRRAILGAYKVPSNLLGEG